MFKQVDCKTILHQRIILILEPESLQNVSNAVHYCKVLVCMVIERSMPLCGCIRLTPS